MKNGIFYKDGYKHHLIGTFTDNGQTFYIAKWFGRYKQWWHYVILDEESYNFYYERTKKGVRGVIQRKCSF